MPTIAMAQMAASDCLEDNVEKSLRAIEAAAGKGADVVLFPEIQLSPFFPKTRNGHVDQYLLTIDDPVIRKFQEACAKAQVIAVPNIYLSEGASRFDASIMIDRGGEILGISKMVHVTQAPGFYEQDYYTPSDEGFKVYGTDVGTIGIVICFDRHFPESIRSCVLRGADIILIPTANTAGEAPDLFEWEMRVAAFQNSVYVAMCNRVGTEDAVTYCGQSLLASPDGQLVSIAGANETLEIAGWDNGFVKSKRQESKFLELYNAEAFAANTEKLNKE